MGLEKIKGEILEKAAAAEREILAEASAKVREMRERLKGRIMQLEQESAQNLDAEKRAMENRENSIANLEAQKLIFGAKRELLEKAYAEAFGRIMKMPKNERGLIVKRLLEKAQKEIDVAVVYANSSDAAFIGKNFRVKISDSISGCIICETEDGTVRVDYTFDTIFQEVREKTVQQASKMLFG